MAKDIWAEYQEEQKRKAVERAAGITTMEAERQLFIASRKKGGLAERMTKQLDPNIKMGSILARRAKQRKKKKRREEEV